MDHILFLQKIREGKKNEYIKSHKNIPEEILKKQKEFGFKRIIVWIYKDMLLVYQMAENIKDATEKITKEKEHIDFMEKMKSLIIPQDFSAGINNVNLLEKVYDFEEAIKKLDNNVD